MHWFEPGFTVAVLGRRHSGKSVLMKELMYTVRGEFPLVIVMTGTSFNGWYDGWVPPTCIFSGYKEGVVTKLLTRQRRILATNRTLPAAEHTNPNVLLVLDDVVGEREAQGSHILQEIFTTGRHLHVSIILATQHVTARVFPPCLRVNSDLVFVFAQTSEESIDVVAGQWLCGVGTKREGITHLHAVTRSTPFCALVIHARKAAASHTLQEFTCAHVARTDLPPFHMCARIYWQGHKALDDPPRKRLHQRVWAWVASWFEEDSTHKEEKSPTKE
jgi:hypothetical protein